MDVLSDAVAAMRIGRPHAALARHAGAFGARLPAADGAGFHVLVRGTGRLTFPGGGVLDLAEGDAVLLPRGPAHDLSGAEAVVLCGAYLMDRSRPHPLLGGLPETVTVRGGTAPGLDAAVLLLHEELARERPGRDGMLAALLEVLLLQLLRAWQATADPAAGWPAALRDPGIVRVLSAVHAEPGRAWTVEELGARAGLSRAAFARRFTALVGRPPLSYVTWWRMTLAARLLRDSDAPLAAVARRVGYGSEFAFAHAFKRIQGTAPGAFRSAVAGVEGVGQEGLERQLRGADQRGVVAQQGSVQGHVGAAGR